MIKGTNLASKNFLQRLTKKSNEWKHKMIKLRTLADAIGQSVLQREKERKQISIFNSESLAHFHLVTGWSADHLFAFSFPLKQPPSTASLLRRSHSVRRIIDLLAEGLKFTATPNTVKYVPHDQKDRPRLHVQLQLFFSQGLISPKL